MQAACFQLPFVICYLQVELELILRELGGREEGAACGVEGGAREGDTATFTSRARIPTGYPAPAPAPDSAPAPADGAYSGVAPDDVEYEVGADGSSSAALAPAPTAAAPAALTAPCSVPGTPPP